MNATRSAPPHTAQAATRRGARQLLTALVLLGGLVAGWTAPGAARADVPGRVGRIAFIEGDVQSYSESEPEWKVAYLNEPITSRNSIFVGDGARAEISVGSTTLAMDAGSQVDIQQLDDNTFNANVVHGRVSMRLRRVDAGDQYNVGVPGSAFVLLAAGRYRIDAVEGATGITVFAGQASVQAEGGPAPIAAGNALRVVTNAQSPDAAPQLVAVAPVPVALDDWVVTREERFRESAVAQRYVSPNMTGYEDLDVNGQWSSEPDVGPIWYPRTYVRADWAPYRYGRWAYVAPWGYTWVDDAPWGFAPFHYGRWIQVGNRWGWCPGAYVARPVYAPALVGFYGGSGFSASFSVGAGPAVGWYPLAPWERFSPHYPHNTAYVNQVNNITIVNAPTRFATRGGWNRERGATVAPRDSFASQRSISQVAIAAPRNLFDHAAPVGGAELPRPNAVPGAIRRGPTMPNGDVHPEFRAPREFAQRGPLREGRPEAGRPEAGRPDARPADARPVEARTQQPGFNGRPGGFNNQPGGPRDGEARGIDRNALPPNDRRAPEAPRPAVAPEAPRVAQPGAVPVERNDGRSNERFGDRINDRRGDRGDAPRGANAPNFSREGRPVPQPAAQALPQAPAAVAPNAQPSFERFGPRQQAMPRNEGEVDRGRRELSNGERNFERPNREFRAPQAPQAVPAPQVQQALPQPVARPQPIERPQRIERPAPAPVAAPVPQAPAAVPAAPAQAPRGPGPRGDPNDRARER